MVRKGQLPNQTELNLRFVARIFGKDQPIETLGTEAFARKQSLTRIEIMGYTIASTLPLYTMLRVLIEDISWGFFYLVIASASHATDASFGVLDTTNSNAIFTTARSTWVRFASGAESR